MTEAAKVKIKEIFNSIQGEGLYVGQMHTFVRFCKCNLKCGFCDTDFTSNNAKEYSSDELGEILLKQNSEMISFTGGEPLVEIDFLYNFLKKYKNKLNQKIYLETNGTLYENLAKIVDYTDIISMDIKLKSATGEDNRFFDNEQFLKISLQKEVFIKIVFDKNITDKEIKNCTQLCKKYNTPIILQPKMPLALNSKEITEIFNKFYKDYKNIRLIGQLHKFFNLA